MLLCIHNEDNVPPIINLLEASHATDDSPIVAIALILVKLVGRTAPMLIAHQAAKTLEPATSRSGHIINALRTYESENTGRLTVQPYTSISHFATMHEDVCRLALDQYTNIVIIPFHRTWAIDGKFGQPNRAIRDLNLKVMENVPCTVGVLIDRGNIISGPLKILNSQSIYNVAVIYIGGLDDVESLCYGARMASHHKVALKVIRILLFGTDNARERKFDNNLIDEVRNSQMGNLRFSYHEEVVRDGVGLASVIRKFEQGFDLMLVGRTHQKSPLMAGLDEWSECPELGVIGDLMASPDIATTTSVLVVQQQRVVGGNLTIRSSQPVVVDMHLHGVSRVMKSTTSSLSSHSYDSAASISTSGNVNLHINDNNSSWAIPMNKV